MTTMLLLPLSFLSLQFVLRRSGWPLLSLLLIVLVVSSSNAQPSSSNFTNATAIDTATSNNATEETEAPTTAGIATTGSECSEAKAIECLTAENRICEKYDEEEEENCGACVDGFVEIPVESAESEMSTQEGETDRPGGRLVRDDNSQRRSTSTRCVDISTELQLALFDRLYKPSYSSSINISVEDEQAEANRLEILRENAQFVSSHNRQPSSSYQLSLNEFSADTPQEAQLLGGYVVPTGIEEGTSPILKFLVAMELATNAILEPEIPTQIDWVQKGAVTSVKNQGRCGGCWSVSIAGAIEGAAAIWSNYTYLQSVSFQQLISCDKTNGGCNGGFPSSALVYANIRGTATLNDYPFVDGDNGQTTEECYINEYEIAVDSKKGQAVTYYGAVGDDTYEIRMSKMKQGLSRQPIAVAIKSECKTFKNYKSGVITDDGDCACSPLDLEGCLDHAVLLVGFDDAHDPPYWKIKNSWGTDWGEDGYVRIAQTNPNFPNPNSWGLFGLLAEGVAPLQAFNQTQQVYDEPQDVGRETWERVIILACVFLAAAALGIALAVIKTKYCSGDHNNDDNKDEPQTQTTPAP